MINLDFVYPTLAESRNIDVEHIGRFYHFEIGEKQLAINNSARGFSVMAQGWIAPKCSDFRCDGWYTVKRFKSFDECKMFFIQCCVDLLVDVRYSYAK